MLVLVSAKWNNDQAHVSWSFRSALPTSPLQIFCALHEGQIILQSALISSCGIGPKLPTSRPRVCSFVCLHKTTKCNTMSDSLLLLYTRSACYVVCRTFYISVCSYLSTVPTLAVYRYQNSLTTTPCRLPSSVQKHAIQD